MHFNRGNRCFGNRVGPEHEVTESRFSGEISIDQDPESPGVRL